MSLQAAAQHLSSHGRGNDSMMVHMSPREVSSLNAIAKAHGGQLTTNPHTGLPEAGFLESILPMAAGAALTAAGVPVGMAAFGVGAGMTLMTGSLEKGLMAGLGAYGGSSLGASLMAGGATPAAAGMAEAGAATATAESQIAMQKALEEQAKAAALASQNTASIQQAATVTPPVGYPSVAAPPITAPAAPITTPAAPVDASVNPNHYSVMTGNSPAFQAAVPPKPSFMDNIKAMGSNISPSSLMNFAKDNPLETAAGAASLYSPKKNEEEEEAKADASMGQRYAYSPGYANPMPGASASGQEPTFMDPSYRKIDNAEAKKIYGFADGGATADPAAPPVPTSYTAAQPSTPITTPAPAFEVPEVNSLADLIRAKESQRFIDAYLNRPAPIDVQGQYNDYLQRTLNAPPTAVANSGVRTTAPSASTNADDEYIFDANTQRYVPNPKLAEAKAKTKKKSFFDGSGATNKVNFGGGFGRAAGGSISDAGYNLGGYSDGGRLLRGPGDGVSDSIPAVIGKKQPARLADGEFVVPARIVSELGNGSTEAGARKLYAMMDRIQSARRGTVGKGRVAKNSRSEKYLPA